MSASKRRLRALIAAFAMMMAVTLGTAPAFATSAETPLAQDEAQAAAQADNPVGLYDADSLVYTNDYFGISYAFDDAWSVTGIEADGRADALDTVDQMGSVQELLALNMGNMQILYGMTFLNDGVPVDEAYLEQNGASIAQALMASDSAMSVVDSKIGSMQITTPEGSIDMPTYWMEVKVEQGGEQISAYTKLAFISEGDYSLMLAAITYQEDTTDAVLSDIDLLGAASSVAAVDEELIGVYDTQTHTYSNVYFGIQHVVSPDWSVCFSGTDEERAFAMSALEQYGFETDMMMQNVATGEAVAVVVTVNEDGSPVDENYVMEYADYAVCAFLTAAGLVDDPEIFGEDLSYLTGFAKEIEPRLIWADNFVRSDSHISTCEVAGVEVPCAYLAVTASTEAGELPLYVTIAFVPQGDYVCVVGAASYDNDSTQALLSTFEAVQGGQTTEPAPTGGTTQTGGGATFEQVRYGFEHSSLMRLFYENPQAMLDFLSENSMYLLWESFSTENGADVTFSPSDFATYVYPCDNGYTLYQFDMPLPEVSPQCYRIYMLYNAESGDAGYFTIEKEDLFSENGAMVCLWDPSGNHRDFGSIEVTQRGSADYEEALEAEASIILDIVGLSAAA